jgi:7-carboxy-7-deazaguanine synthase (Cx14CxxC type)
MSYSVKEIYYTLQGEGANTGRAAVFCRFAGCNLWTGREKDRTSAICSFCDTDFVGTDGPGGGHFETADDLSNAAAVAWAASRDRAGVKPLIVCTGGEPLLQLDHELVSALHDKGFSVAFETNGTRLPPPDLDWICVSPKAGAKLILRSGNELKLIFPQSGAEPSMYDELSFEHFFIQPMDGPEREANIRLAVEYCLQNPKWRLSLQMHKMVGIP